MCLYTVICVAKYFAQGTGFSLVKVSLFFLTLKKAKEANCDAIDQNWLL